MLVLAPEYTYARFKVGKTVFKKKKNLNFEYIIVSCKVGKNSKKNYKLNFEYIIVHELHHANFGQKENLLLRKEITICK